MDVVILFLPIWLDKCMETIIKIIGYKDYFF